MMFSAGMGIGLMFYGVAEPLSTSRSPPPGTVKAGTPQAFRPPWPPRSSTGRCTRGRSTPSSGSPSPTAPSARGRSAADQLRVRARCWASAHRGPASASSIDILAIFATLFGSAASLGLGALQIGSGLQLNGGSATVGTTCSSRIIAVLTVAFVASAVSGIAKGIQWLSNINMVLAGVLALFVFVAGPTILILDLMPTAIGDYFGDLAEMAARTAADRRRRHGRVAVRLDGLLLGLVDLVDAVRRHVHRPDQPRPHDQAVRRRRDAHPQRREPPVVRDLRRRGDQPASAAAPTWRARARRASCSGCSTRCRSARVLSIIAMLLVAIFFVSGADAASIVMGTLSQQGTIEPHAGSWSSGAS